MDSSNINAEISKTPDGYILTFQKNITISDFSCDLFINNQFQDSLLFDITSQKIFNLSINETEELSFIEIKYQNENIAEYLHVPNDIVDYSWQNKYQAKIENISQGVIKAWLRYKDKRKQQVSYEVLIHPEEAIYHGVTDVRRIDLLEKGFEYGFVGVELDLSKDLCDGKPHDIYLRVEGETLASRKNYCCTTKLEASLESISENKIQGWALNTKDTSNKLKVELKDEEGLVKLAVAETNIFDNITNQYEALGHSFEIEVPPSCDINKCHIMISGELKLEF